MSGKASPTSDWTLHFDALATRFIKSARPNASELEVGNAVTRLRMQVAAGEIDRNTVMQRMRAATSTSPWAYSFGDQARACRDADAGQLSAQEKAFVAQMCALGFARTPTRKQQAWLRSIFGRLNRRAA